jgi:ribosomal-protein-alanine N-acetyltransferase
MAWQTHRSLADTQVFLDLARAEWEKGPAGSLLIESRATGRLIGSTGLHFEASPESAVVGYVLARDAWQQGYATEALAAMVVLARSLNVRRLHAVCHAEHRASAHVLEKNGFQCAGRLPRHTLFPNISTEPCDVLSFSLELSC